jgi:hypothetical protein
VLDYFLSTLPDEIASHPRLNFDKLLGFALIPVNDFLVSGLLFLSWVHNAFIFKILGKGILVLIVATHLLISHFFRY